LLLVSTVLVPKPERVHLRQDSNCLFSGYGTQIRKGWIEGLQLKT
jgi:hypothetical protein